MKSWRRWLDDLWVAFATVAVALVGLAGCGASGNSVLRMRLTSRGLSGLGGFPVLSVVGNRLVVSDIYDTSFAHGRVGGVCGAAWVNPNTLRLTRVAHGDCGDPALFGERVIPIAYAPTTRNHPGWGVNPLAIRIALVGHSRPPGYRLGPVIVTYPDASDTRAETIQGDGSLWVYAPTIKPRANLGALLRVSLTNGRVVQRWRMPTIDRALLATNADGLWLAPSIESGWPAGVSRSSRTAYTSLYHVAPGMRRPTRVFDAGPYGARWLVADRHSVWLDDGPANGTHTLWRFHGPKARAALRGARTAGGVRECGDLGEQFVTVVGSASGIFCVTNPNPGVTVVQRLSASGGRSRAVARFSTPGNYVFPDNAVLYRDAYYFVDPASGELPTLYRVAPT